VQALILAGGEGTRLRPLTNTVPKAVIPLVDRPLLAHMVEWLRGHGIDDVVLSCGHLAGEVRAALGDTGLTYVDEPRPLGTGGALKHAEGLLAERFLMLNGDVLCDFDLGTLVDAHERTGARATLALTAVDDPSAYGLVRTAPGGAVTGFVEKPPPDEADTRDVSAGVYVLERSVLDLLPPGEPASIERDVFPRLVGAGLHAVRCDGYWLDLGTPERYLQATFDLLDRRGEEAVIGDGAQVDPDARLGRHVVLGRGVTVAAGASVERAVVLDGAHVGRDCVLRDCIVAAGARVEDRRVVEEAIA